MEALTATIELGTGRGDYRSVLYSLALVVASTNPLTTASCVAAYYVLARHFLVGDVAAHVPGLPVLSVVVHPAPPRTFCAAGSGI